MRCMLFFFGMTMVWFCSLECVKAQTAAAMDAYQDGYSYYKLQNYERALSLFKQAIKADSNFLDAYRAAIACLDALDQSKEALPYYLNAIRVAPADKKLHYNLALTYMENKEYDQAKIYLNKALEIDPLYTKASTQLNALQRQKQSPKVESTVVEQKPYAAERRIYQRALNAYKQGRYQACLDTLQNYSGTIALANTQYLRGIALQQVGDRVTAKKAYQKALLLEDDHLNSHLNLGRIYYNERDYGKAATHLSEVYRQRSEDDRLLYDLAKAYYYNEAHKKAAELLRTYVDRQPQSGEAWRLLGNSYRALDQSKRAAEAYDRAQQYGAADDQSEKRFDQSVADYGNKAREYAQQGNYEGAINLLEHAVSEYPEEASLYFNLGLNYLEVGNSKRAKIQFLKTIELEPRHAKAYQALGLLYYDQERYREAGAYYLSAIEAGKADDVIYYKLGSCWYRLNRYIKAEQAYKKAIEKNPIEKRYHMSLGLTYLATKEQNKAIDAFKEALKLDADCLDCQYHIAAAWFNMNEYQRCMDIAEAIVEQDDSFAKAYLLIGHAYHRMGKYGLAQEYQRKAQRLDPSLKY